MAEQDRENRIVPALPTLVSGAALSRADKSGVWKGHVRLSPLKEIAEGIELNKTEEGRREIVSTPDVWAQTVEFEHGLIHNDAGRIGEWRGLLAIWALSTVRELALECEKCVLENMKTKDSGTETAGINSFASVAESLQPNMTISTDMTWSEIGVMTLDKTPIGLVVPSTIVTPTRNAGKALDGRVFWFQNGKLTDPLKKVELTEYEKQTLFYAINWFLSEYENQLENAGHEGVNTALAGQIRTLLENYRQDILQSLRGKEPQLEFETNVRNFSLPRGKMFNLLNRSFSPPKQEHFAACLYPRKEFENSFKGAILAFDKLDDVIGTGAEQIQIWDIITLSNLKKDESVIDKIRTDAADFGYLTLKPQDFFTEYLCELGATGNNVRNHDGLSDSFVLPLNPRICLFMSPSDIKKNIHFERTGSDGPVIVSLTLWAKNSSGEDVAILIEQSYPKEKIATARTPEALAMWPNFKTEGWRYNYVYGSTTGDKDLRFVCPFEISAAQRALKATHNRKQLLETVETVANTIFNDIDRRVTKKPEQGKKSGQEAAIYRTESPSEAMICQVEVDKKTAPGTDAREMNVSVDAGILLLPFLESVPTHGAKWKVAIDFGTTNTAIFHQIGGTENMIAPLEFEDRTVNAFSGEEVALATFYEMSDDFIPPMQPPMPFQTILAWTPGFGGGHRRPILSDRISFHSEGADYLSHTLNMLRTDGGTSNLKTNLKWNIGSNAGDSDTGDETRADIRMFLSHAALAAMAEAAARGTTKENIMWLFSYPEAFHDHEVAGFQMACEEAIAMAMTPDKKAQARIETQVEFETESISSAYYFEAQQEAFFTNTVITLDMGGGTSDISIWQNNELKWHGSALLAGRNIFIDYLKQRPELMERIIGESAGSLLPQIKKFAQAKTDENSRTAAIEAVVNSEMFDDSFVTDRSTILNSGVGKNLITQAEFALSGLLYYTGMICASLAKEGRLNLDETAVRLCLGGRGSKLFSTLFNVGAKNKEDAQKKFSAIFQRTSGFKQEAQPIYFSVNPKLEVAHGLIARIGRNDKSDLITDKASTTSIIGLSVIADGVEYGPDQSYLEMADAEKWSIKDLKELESFMQIHSEVFQVTTPANKIIPGVKGLIDDSLSKIKKDAQEARQKQKEHSSIVSSVGDSLFIVAIAAMLEKMNKDGNYISRSETR